MRLKFSTTLRFYLRHELPCELAAAASMALGLQVFAAPNFIVCGGVSGIAAVLYNLWAVPIGASSLAMNLPLLLLGYRQLGRRFVLRTLRVVVIISLMMDVVFVRLGIGPYHGERLLAAIFGGAFTGLGLGLILMRGDTTGGSDILVKLIQRRRPHLSMGTVVMVTDLVVVLFAAIAYRSVDAILYGGVMIYLSTAVIDRLIAGADARKMALIITRTPAQTTGALLSQLNRGVTVFDARGGFSGEPLSVLLCVVERQQLFELKKITYQSDPRAFVIVTQAMETLGEGFKRIEELL